MFLHFFQSVFLFRFLCINSILRPFGLTFLLFEQYLHIGFLLHRRTDFLLQILENDVEHRNDEKQCQCSYKHTAPAPLENINGSIPNIIVSTVIRIGRRRTWAAE